jgi:subtilisin family serine protease
MTARVEPASPSERVLIFTVDSSREDSARAASEILQYVKSNRATTRISPLNARRGGYRHGNGPWEFDDPTEGAHLGNGTYILWTKSTSDTFEFERALKHVDPKAHVTASYRQRPAPERASSAVAPIHRLAGGHRHANAAELIAEANKQRQWGLIRCGFPAVRKRLDTGSKYPAPGPIGMIDIGKRRQHPALDDSIVHCEPPTIGKPSIADHASSVAAIIGARGNGMDGCCSANIVLYNVWTRNDGLDQRALYNALEEAITAQLPVVNLSVWVEEDDPHLRALIAKCEENNVVVVAAMGNSGNCGQRFYPAAYLGVIAVAATNAADDRQVDSTVGDWAFIAAPGEDILTVVGDQRFDRFSGTSFAAPCVSAAVWLAKRNNPTGEPLTNSQIRWLLAQCVDIPRAERNPEVGFGRLDITRLEASLSALPSREDCAKRFSPAGP